ncbi:MAG TPA: hypothetical protein VMT30_03295 [Candidatus Saccharimonadia bacterium]|nr:hypothetical protein [Candidatus Saccharimonadia bacterium]
MSRQATRSRPIRSVIAAAGAIALTLALAHVIANPHPLAGPGIAVNQLPDGVAMEDGTDERVKYILHGVWGSASRTDTSRIQILVNGVVVADHPAATPAGELTRAYLLSAGNELEVTVHAVGRSIEGVPGKRFKLLQQCSILREGENETTPHLPPRAFLRVTIDPQPPLTCHRTT